MEKKILVVASGNKGKLREIEKMLPEYEIKGYLDCGLDFDIEEDGETFYDNALIKAKTVSEKLGVPALADDSGLCVDALDGGPGIYSARYSGKGDKGNNDLLLKNLENITDINKRSARFVCCRVVYFPDGKILTANGETEGYITFAPEGEHGFGYDPIFYSLDLNKTLGIASDEEKNTISHRFRAVSKVRDLLKEKDI